MQNSATIKEDYTIVDYTKDLVWGGVQIKANDWNIFGNI